MAPESESTSEDASVVIRNIAAQQLSLYRREPRELISHFNREVSALDGYRGRQILELLQNADDAAADLPDGSRVIFALDRKRLVVANTGTPFSQDGLMSLVISDCSPKQLEQNRFIGCKGLGFRAVLTWTTRPFILSGKWCVRFEKTHALTTVKRLVDDEPSPGGVIQRFVDSTGHWPAPVMRFPESPAPQDEDLVLARGLQTQGYDTVLVLPLEDGERGDRAFSEAEQQLRELPTTSLLFCRHLNEVVIKGQQDRRWSILREPVDEEHFRVIIDDGEADRYWEVSRRSGTVSQDASEDISGGRREFETAVAVPESWDYDTSENCLCVFFPTRDRLPCPVMLHATLETTEDRNRLVEHSGNREVLQSLANHFIDVVETQVDEDNPLRALRMISGVEAADPELQHLGLLESVIDACRTRALFPRLDGAFGPASATHRSPQDVWLRVLDPEHFPEVLDVSSKAGVSALLKCFELEWIDGETLKERLRGQLAEMDPEDAGKVIGRLLNANQLRPIGVGGLLMDDTNSFIEETQECFSNPTEMLPELPAWASDVRFLHPSFQDGMLETAGASTLRGLVSELERNQGHVSEYRFDTVARAVIGKVNDGEETADDSLKAKWRDLYPWLLNASRSSRQALSQLATKVITVDGELERSADCYLSNAYPRGEVPWNLYSSIHEISFVATPDQLGLADNEITEVEQFLIAIGVRASPKIVSVTRSQAMYRSFLNHVIDTLPYPLTVRGALCNSAAELLQLCNSHEITGLSAPEHFVRLLEDGNPTAVVGYLLSSGGVHLQSERAEGAVFQAMISSERRLWDDPSVPIPNMLMFWLQECAWIPCSDGKKHRPSEVMLSSVGLRVLQGVYSKHLIDPRDPFLLRHGGRPALDSLLMRLGAVASLESMGSEQVYELLLGLPERDPDGEAASSIYRTLLESNIGGEEGTARTRFMRVGLVWAKHHGRGQYLPHKEVRYNANVTVPQVVESGIALLDLPRRKSGKIVEQLLGVVPLAAKDITISVVSDQSEYDSGSEDANAFLRRCIPFIYALRLGKKLDDDLRERNLLKNVHLYVCHQVTVDVAIPGKESERLVLNQSGSRIAIDSSLYLVGEYDPGSSGTTRFWLAVAGLIAELLGTDVAADVGAVLRCKSEQEMRDVVEELLGQEAKDKIAEAHRRFEELFVQDDEEEDVSTWLPPEDETKSPEVTPADETPSDSEETPSDENKTTEPTQGEADIDGTKFEETTGPEPRKRKRRKLIVKKPGGGGGGGGNGPVATEDVTFRIVDAFERQDGDGRFVINVSHLQGSEAFGCDLISVRTEALREQILESRIVNDSDVERFIEVKGRSSRTGEVELTPNEYRAAEKHRGRYYIYRVFVEPDDRSVFEVAVLCDPTNSNAVRTVTRFDLAEGSGANWYQIEEKEEDVDE